MSYFTSTKWNEWTYEIALKYYIDNYEDKNEAYRNMEKHLKEVVDDINRKPLIKKKAEFLLNKLPPVESTCQTPENIHNHNTFHMNDNSNVNYSNYINENGKRVYAVDGSENEEFLQRLLKTANTSQGEEAWKVDQIYERKIHKQQLLYYNIIDLDLKNSPIAKQDLDLSQIMIVKFTLYLLTQIILI
ncbi:hypothetical protein BD770DRAFT_147101 [Pilaira anomala]|nr:hypothetical protein BD770DRAFT_147101 [Pilaira anomala]